jgi:hypothetical protein
MARLDNTILEAALLGYQAEQKRIQAAIAELQKRIGGKSATPKAPPVAVARKKHRISAEGRARIAAAQRKRWAAAKKEDSSK